MWVFDKNSDESYIHVCEGKTLKKMQAPDMIEIRKHDISTFTIVFDQKGKPVISHIKFCPYCGTDLHKEEA